MFSSVLMILPIALILMLLVRELITDRSSSKTSRNNSEEISKNSEKARDIDDLLTKNIPLDKERPTENHLLRFRLLLYTKLTLYTIQSLTFITLAALFSHKELSNTGATVVFAINALGSLLTCYLSYRHHKATWRCALALPSVLVGWTVVLAIRARTVWSTLGVDTNKIKSAHFGLLIAAIAIYLLAILVESFLRITRERFEKVCLIDRDVFP